jgi:hypothetical protein
MIIDDEKWLLELTSRLKAKKLAAHQIDKATRAWKVAVNHSLYWLGYVCILPDESYKIINTAIKDADFDLEKFRVDHTTHPLTFL